MKSHLYNQMEPGEMVAVILDLKNKLMESQSKLELEHQNFLAVHRDNMKAIGRIDELKALAERYKKALEKIARVSGLYEDWPKAQLLAETAREALEEKANG